jgi:small subunit ribosomal protein S2
VFLIKQFRLFLPDFLLQSDMAKMTTEPTGINQEVQELFNLGAHLGHRKSRVHPKSYRYIHKIMNGVSIIDLTKTVTLLKKARTFLEKEAKEGKKILVVTTKKNLAGFTAEISQKYNVPYTTTKWLPGLITNFDTIIKNVKKLEEMKESQANGGWEQFVKHERTAMSKELFRLERFYKGLVGLRQKPDILLVIDTRKEKNAVTEARMAGIPVVAIVDTNSNPEEVAYPIVMNDDAPEVVQHILNDLLKLYGNAYTEKKAAVTEGSTETAPAEVAPEAKKEDKRAKKAPAKAKKSE